MFGIAQNHLLERIAKLDINVHCLYVADSVVRHRSRDVGKFLIQKIRGLGHMHICEVDALSVGLLGGVKRQLDNCGRSGRMHVPGEQKEAAENEKDYEQACPERNRKPASLFAVGALTRFHYFPDSLGRMPNARKIVAKSTAREGHWVPCASAPIRYRMAPARIARFYSQGRRLQTQPADRRRVAGRLSPG